jgi:hypothetical protein
MIVYGIASAVPQDVSEFFRTEDEARVALERVWADAPELKSVLWIEPYGVRKSGSHAARLFVDQSAEPVATSFGSLAREASRGAFGAPPTAAPIPSDSSAAGRPRRHVVFGSSATTNRRTDPERSGTTASAVYLKTRRFAGEPRPAPSGLPVV